MIKEFAGLFMQPVGNRLCGINWASTSNTDDGIDARVLSNSISGLIQLGNRSMLLDIRKCSRMMFFSQELLDLFDQKRLSGKRRSGDDKGFRIGRG